MDPRNYEQPRNPRQPMPDLPMDWESEDEVLFHDAPVRSQTQSPRTRRTSSLRRGEDVVRTQAAVAYPTRDIVQHVRPSVNRGGSGGGGRRTRRQEIPWYWSAPILPSSRQIMEQVFPNFLIAFSAILAGLVGGFSPLGFPIWAIVLFLPTVLFALLANNPIRPMWQRTALINLATVAVIFPALVVRQSMLRVPFVELGNGTLLAPGIATAIVILLLSILAITCTILCREDPEYAGVVFLPAAMMVPFLAGVTSITSLGTALRIVAIVFVVSALLTVIVSMLPAAYSMLIPPIAIGLEFLILTVVRNGSIFPIGSGNLAKVLFFVVVLVTVGYSIGVSVGSAWVRQVNRVAQSLRSA